MNETLNIFKLSEQLLMDITSDSILNNMQKIWRHVFYPKMVDIVLEMHSLAYHANTDPDGRAEYLKKFLGCLKQLESLTRVAHERRMLSHKKSDYLFRIYESLGKQAAAWRKKAKQTSCD